MTELYSMGAHCPAGATELKFQASQPFRLRYIRTNVKEENLVTINEICINNGESELLQPIDGYLWSQILNQKLLDEFTKEHNLIGKSEYEIEEYLDTNDLTLPDVGRLTLQTLRISDQLIFKGVFSVATCIVLIGDTPTKQDELHKLIFRL